MAKAQSHRRAVGRGVRMVRAAKTVCAAEAIGPVVPGLEVYVLTFGQFSLIDALHYLVEQTGPADDDVAVVTAAGKAKVVKLDKLPRRARAPRPCPPRGHAHRPA